MDSSYSETNEAILSVSCQLKENFVFSRVMTGHTSVIPLAEGEPLQELVGCLVFFTAMACWWRHQLEFVVDTGAEPCQPSKPHSCTTAIQTCWTQPLNWASSSLVFHPLPSPPVSSHTPPLPKPQLLQHLFIVSAWRTVFTACVLCTICFFLWSLCFEWYFYCTVLLPVWPHSLRETQGLLLRWITPMT